MVKKRINFTIDRELAGLFKSYCEERHHKMSAIVEKLIREELGVLGIRKEQVHPHHRGIG